MDLWIDDFRSAPTYNYSLPELVTLTKYKIKIRVEPKLISSC